ncbi:carboxypeptidase regulatory-like domain-containing protein [Pedobacter gandavensis]|uniref:TonB-dependent receptor n=1 Tax=Pedobacter gandavensis TaxID=2679963 RepID=UPI00292F7529|nr:carboxypeptidase regulatory-like domain-containing protein [Pedobacter gandavensis]
MKKSLLFKVAVIIFAFVGFISNANAQVTTSNLNGIVADAKGPLPGATIVAVHNPTGTRYTASSNTDGRYNFVNINTGGPYTVTASYIGYKVEKIEGVYLKLGETFTLKIKLSEGGQNLEEVQVVGKNSTVLNSKRTGASTTIGKKQIEEMPTLSRSLSDITRLTPQANGNSFAGSNNRFNNITIDGAVNNDVFGLSANGTPGGPAGTQPISLDAIQEVQVVIAPYDITQGSFTGGGVNAITRSGTNTVEGSAYFYGRNQNTIGKSVDGLNTKATEFYNTTFGARLGAPIIKDKLFVFASVEATRVKQPTTFNAGDPGSVLSIADAQRIANFAQTTYGYDVGAFNEVQTQTQSNKFLVRLDWNINDKHQLTLRNNYVDAFDDNLSRSASSFRFGNNGYRFKNTQNVSILELRSRFNQTLSNNLIIGYSRIRDSRVPNGSLFPQITINNLNGVAGQSASLGTERSSAANELDQDIFEFTDNFKIFAGKHTFTVGTHNEFFKFRNLFINNANGYWQYNNVDDYINQKPNRVQAAYSIVPGDNRPAAAFSAAQLGFYFQDEIEVADNFKLTAGLRVDVPLFFDKPLYNPLVASAFPGYNTAKLPSGQILVSPRMGFNWDVTGDRTMQVRGGLGLFTGRVPFVWMANQFTNSGMLYGSVDQTATTTVPIAFVPDPNKQNTAGTPGKTYEVNLLSDKFKLPQVLRYSLGTDIKLPGGILATLDGIYSKTINNVNYSNINIKGRTGTLAPNLSGGQDTRPTYGGKVDATFTNVLLLDNTSEGSSYSLTAQLSKSFNFGLSAMVAYNYGKSQDVNSGASSTAFSNWQFLQIVNDPNNAPVAYSNFDLRHRVIGSLSYGVNYGKNKTFGTTFSMFYVGKSGSPFTYLYFGDLNGDGANQNDLMYVPRNASEIKLVPYYARNSANQVIVTPGTATPAEQWAALDNYISNDPYLSKHRGEYTERNGARMPWEHQFDVRVMQDLGGMIHGTKNRLQLSVDIINVGNLLNKDWGRKYFVSNSANTLINYNTTQASDRGFNFKAPSTGSPYSVSGFDSRWQAQIGLRYIFN